MMEEKKSEYDFKYIKRKFKNPNEDKMYLEEYEIDKILK